MKKSFLKISLLGVAFGGLLFSACERQPDTPTQEIITTVKLVFSDPTGASQTVVWKDADGDGGLAPTIGQVNLKAGTIYDCGISILNESVSPTEDITAEILAEKEVHLFTFKATGANLTATYSDSDANGKPVGLVTKMTTGAASSGSLIIKLHHEPTDKNNLADPGGDIDIEVEFPVVIN